MEELRKLHDRFLQATLEINRFNDNPVSIMPSVIFLTSNFLLIYMYCHRYTRVGFTSFKAWFFREVTFQWSFFYMSKMWYIFLKSFKFSCQLACNEIASKHPFVVCPRHCNLVGLFILSVVSTIPLIIFIFRACTFNSIPNFLMWVGEDPWLRSEIGLAGHYLERPPPLIPMENSKPRAYSTRRSCSVEQTAQTGTYIRISKSLQLM